MAQDTLDFVRKLTVHLRLEDQEGCGIGSGRIELLRLVGELGSLNKAAKSLGMSYRAAWGSLRRTESIVGLELVNQCSSKRSGSQLTVAGQALVSVFQTLEADTRRFAEERAKALFPGLDG